MSSVRFANFLQTGSHYSSFRRVAAPQMGMKFPQIFCETLFCEDLYSITFASRHFGHFTHGRNVAMCPHLARVQNVMIITVILIVINSSNSHNYFWIMTELGSCVCVVGCTQSVDSGGWLLSCTGGDALW